ncbi:uncharacterized protein BYT42DRAFT_400763 [Radiomyces spectabilis]|uniref:uncharacterized protein n=1 Tax=Radiomyces spectabilis TaxID=64574 RepID=UPI00221F32EA|nr:uncharacterized protein BYT42DRAFT_400763 [Radiomyces spectabilis]KAI8374345.1 hypothetical protein BYT42DRAFT_400763 [Radiomyces spectabilis]
MKMPLQLSCVRAPWIPFSLPCSMVFVQENFLCTTGTILEPMVPDVYGVYNRLRPIADISGLIQPELGICVYSRCATLEAKPCADFTSSRPDLCITKCCGVKWKTSLAYGEAKSAVQEKNHFGLCKDLVKVTAFCKDALDKELMQGILGIQIIGRTVQLYLLTLPAKGLYVMTQLATVKIADSLQTLASLIIELPETPTLPRQKFDQLFTISKDGKKPCHLKIGSRLMRYPLYKPKP